MTGNSNIAPDVRYRAVVLVVMFGAATTMFVGAGLALASSGFLRESMVADVAGWQRVVVFGTGVAMCAGALGLTRWRRYGAVLAGLAWLSLVAFQLGGAEWLSTGGFGITPRMLPLLPAVAVAWLWDELR